MNKNKILERYIFKVSENSLKAYPFQKYFGYFHTFLNYSEDKTRFLVFQR